LLLGLFNSETQHYSTQLNSTQLISFTFQNTEVQGLILSPFSVQILQTEISSILKQSAKSNIQIYKGWIKQEWKKSHNKKLQKCIQNFGGQHHLRVMSAKMKK